VNILRKIAFPSIVIVLMFGLIGSDQSPAQEATGTSSENSQKYMGPDVCQGCHESAYETFKKSAHSELLKSKAAADLGCEACHGPGAEHVDAGDPEKIVRFSGMRPEIILAKCTRCHEAELSHAHTKAHLNCLSCHSMHHPVHKVSLLNKPPIELCRRCHK
jgi:hypothetical protein